MPLPEDQVEKIKEQIIGQIKSWDKPEEQKKQAVQQIQQMNSEQLENLLKQNNAIKEDSQENSNQCPFCYLSQNKSQTFPIGENNKAIAILEINPIGKGHTIVIPKEHLPLEQMPNETFDLAKNIVKLLKQKLNPKEVQLSTGRRQDHIILNIIPLTGEESGEKGEESNEDLKKLQGFLLDQSKGKEVSQKEPVNNKKNSENGPAQENNEDTSEEVSKEPEVVDEPRRIP